MYLSELFLVGFKSFAQKTKFNFNDGLTAVVGPNGCGKSNVVDAVRWVLGEKKASVLRSEVMENVIFNGTKDKKPTNLAEVTITLNNNKGILPTEYNQVTVTRRLYRSGDSEYLLNQTKCRLKDIQNLFMDTGMGPDSYSVIELKMVEAILSGRVDERRAMFEEAAGIKKFKQRKRETLRKLDKVVADLERVEDIVDEVRNNVASLSRQAAKTRRYNTHMENLKALELKAFYFEYNKINKDKIELESEINELNKAKISYEIKTSEIEKNAAIYKEELNSTERELSEVKAKDNELSAKVANLNKELAVSNEKLLGFERNKGSIEHEIDDASKALEAQQEKLKVTIKKIDNLTSKKDELSNDFEKKDAELKAIRDKYEDSRKTEEEYKSNSIEIRNRLNTIESVKEKSKQKISYLENKMQQYSESIHSYSQQMEELDSDKETKNSELQDLNTDTDNLRSEFELEKERKLSVENQLRDLKEKISSKKNEQNSVKSSIEFLQSINDLSESSSFILNLEKFKDKEIKILAEELGIDEKYKTALKSALGEYANALIVKDKSHAFEAIDILIENKKGKAVFLNPQFTEKTSSKNSDNPNSLLIDLIRADDYIVNSIRNLIGEYVVAEDIDTAKSIIESGKAEKCVTLEGLLLDKYGFVKGGSFSKNEGITIGKNEKLKTLEKELKAIEKAISGLEEEKNNAQEELNSVDLNSLLNAIKNNENDIKELTKTISGIEIKKESLQNQLENAEMNIDRYNEEINEIETGDSDLDSEFGELNTKLAQLNEEFESFRKEYQKEAEQLSDSETQHRKAEIELVKINSEIDSIRNEQNALSSSISGLKHRIEKKKNALVNLKRENESLKYKIEDYQKNLDESTKAHNEIKNKLDYLTKQKNEKLEEYENINDELKAIRKEYDKVVEKLHTLDIKHSEWKINLENISAKMMETHEIDISEVSVELEDDFDFYATKEEISQIKQKLNNIGNVNFEALDQYEQQSERLRFYEKQIEDLTKSKDTLTDTINEINEAAERNFKETFAKIRENFKKLFITLFGPEGEADILLDESDMLESDIEIKAKPPNKRPHSIEMLSGGEKTLTAIALLFAIYLVKPSPFCILDEVDAPLDDSNIDKFVKLIREFSKDTQFLIVTHNKKTMEASDTLYGITQQEMGISKVVSVQMNGKKEAV